MYRSLGEEGERGAAAPRPRGDPGAPPPVRESRREDTHLSLPAPSKGVFSFPRINRTASPQLERVPVPPPAEAGGAGPARPAAARVPAALGGAGRSEECGPGPAAVRCCSSAPCAPRSFVCAAPGAWVIELINSRANGDGSRCERLTRGGSAGDLSLFAQSRPPASREGIIYEFSKVQ